MLKKIPDTFIIVFTLIVTAAFLTWIIPGGEYTEKENGEHIQFVKVEKQPQTWQIFTAFQKGFQKQASILIFVIIVGGVFWIINASRAIDTSIRTLVSKIQLWEQKQIINSSTLSTLILVLIMLVFSSFGAVFGMSEETIAFIAIIIPLSISLGYDSITGVSVVFVAAGLGFAGAILNPFTIGIAQGIAKLPLFSGIEYRLFCWLIINIIGISYIIIYAKKIRKRPEFSPTYKIDDYWRERLSPEKEQNMLAGKKAWIVFFFITTILIVFSIKHPTADINIGNNTLSIPALPATGLLFFVISILILIKRKLYLFILNLLAFTIIYLVIGVMGFKWYIDEISALFLALGIATAIACEKTGKELVHLFQEGARDILGAAMIIGLAGGIIVILEDGKAIDTILYKTSGWMNQSSDISTIGIMYAIQNILNIIIPSGSAKAAITMPIMAPFSDLIGLSRQATVTAFQFGDGFTNLITPTSGVLMAVLGVAKIPYTVWFKWIAPLILILIITGFLLLIPTVTMSLNGFNQCSNH